MYSVTPADAQWASFTTSAQMVDACRIPDEKLRNMTIEELVKAVWDFPLLIEITAYNSYEAGIAALREISDAYRELLERDDGIEALYDSIASTSKSTGPLSLNQYLIGILLTEESSFLSLSETAQVDVARQLDREGIEVMVGGRNVLDGAYSGSESDEPQRVDTPSTVGRTSIQCHVADNRAAEHATCTRCLPSTALHLPALAYAARIYHRR